MAISNKLLIGLASVGAVTALFASGSAFAQADSTTSGQSLVDRIATKFNLKKAEVQAVVDEDHAAREAERLAEVSQDLQTKVDAGELTSDQKTVIETKLKEQQVARDAEMKAVREWADTNNIDMKYVLEGGRHGNNSNRLQNAVDDGDITAEQKTLIEAKQAELKTARQSQQDALDAWAKQNNIDTDYLHMGMGGPGGRGGDGPQ